MTGKSQISGQLQNPDLPPDKFLVVPRPNNAVDNVHVNTSGAVENQIQAVAQNEIQIGSGCDYSVAVALYSHYISRKMRKIVKKYVY